MRRTAFCLSLLLMFSPWLSGQAGQSSTLVGLAQNSGQTLTLPDGIWLPLLEQTQSLPMDFDSFTAKLTAQVDLLKASNLSLQASNADLTIKNTSLTESLKQSESKAEISEAKSKQLQTELDASTLSITQAQNEARVLALQASGWQIAGIAGLALGVAGLVYGLTR
jgi:hypothetical protein